MVLQFSSMEVEVWRRLGTAAWLQQYHGERLRDLLNDVRLTVDEAEQLLTELCTHHTDWLRFWWGQQIQASSHSQAICQWTRLLMWPATLTVSDLVQFWQAEDAAAEPKIRPWLAISVAPPLSSATHARLTLWHGALQDITETWFLDVMAGDTYGSHAPPLPTVLCDDLLVRVCEAMLTTDHGAGVGWYVFQFLQAAWGSLCYSASVFGNVTSRQRLHHLCMGPSPHVRDMITSFFTTQPNYMYPASQLAPFLLPTILALNKMVLLTGTLPLVNEALYIVLLQHLFVLTTQLNMDDLQQMGLVISYAMATLSKCDLAHLPPTVLVLLPSLLLRAVQANPHACPIYTLEHSGQQLHRVLHFIIRHADVLVEYRVLFARPCWQLWELGWRAGQFRTVAIAMDILALFWIGKLDNCILLTHDQSLHRSLAEVFQFLAATLHPTLPPETRTTLFSTSTPLTSRPDLVSATRMRAMLQQSPQFFLPINPDAAPSAVGTMTPHVHLVLLWQFWQWNIQCIQSWPDSLKDALTDEYIVKPAILPHGAGEAYFEHDVLWQQLINSPRNPYTNEAFTPTEYLAHQTSAAGVAAHTAFYTRRAPLLLDLVQLGAVMLPRR